MNKKYDYLIVGSGLFGATFAYKARQAGKKCLVIDKRPHLGGNVYCENIEGINVHKYGAHIFHTSNKQVWDFVNSIVEFNRYTNSPVANYKGKLYNLPFNMNTFYQMWGVTTPEEAQAKIDEQKAEAIAKMKADGVTEPRKLEEQAQVLIGKDIYERLIKEYTEKQWGRKCTELPAFIIKRLPVRLVFDNNYFNDKYQGIPIGGYNKLIDGLLESVDTLTGVDFFNSLDSSDSWSVGKEIYDYLRAICGNSRSIKEAWKEIASNLVYTGLLDQYFDYRLGKLDWRTVSFKTRVENTPNYQGNAVVNYTSHDEPYTRVIEHKHFEMFGQEVYDCPKTVVSEEYSTGYKDGMESYYPVNNDSNNALVEAYRKLAHQEGVMFPEDLSSLPIGEGRGGAVLFGGRLAEYKYYDMAPIIEKVLNLTL
ncbi:MAG: NAD(P)-binding protein [Prevotella sp.]|nr:NAD(P)-binding protein [Prevotella sp.]